MPRLCSVCRSPLSLEIDQALQAGESLRSVAARFGVSPSAVHRHRKGQHSVGLPPSPQELAERLSRVESQTDRLYRAVELLAGAVGK